MVDDGVIKSFLVSLGFKVEGQDKFDKGLDAATAKAVAMGEAIYDLAKQVAEAMARILPDLDQLYWQTQRLGSSAADIKAYGYAMSQLGGSAKGASAALENIAEFIRSNPSAPGWLTQSLGVSPQHLNDAEKVAQDLSKTFQKMPYWLAKQYAQEIRIDPLQLQAMTRDTGVFEDQYRQMAQRLGIDLDSLAGKSNDAMTRVRELKEEMGLAFDVAEYKALEILVPLLERFSRWVNEIYSGKKLTGIGGQLQQLTHDVLELLRALGILATESYISNFAQKMGDAISHTLKSLSAMVRMVTYLLKGDFASAYKEAVSGYMQTAFALDSAGRGVLGLGSIQYEPGQSAPQGGGVAAPVSSPTGSAGGGPGRGGTRADRNNNPGNIQAVNKGRLIEWVASLPGYMGHDGRFAIFSTPDAGMNAQLALLRKYMRRGWDTIGEIVSHWAPSSENNTRAYIGRVSQMVGINPNTPLMATDLSRIASAMAAVEGYRGGRAHGGVTINQHNQFHAHGGNSRDVTQGVMSQQEAANQRLVSSAGVFAY